MPAGFWMNTGPRPREPKVGHPKRDRSKTKASRRARRAHR